MMPSTENLPYLNLTGPDERAVKLSIVATIYRDGGSVDLLVDELMRAIGTLGLPYEIILVDDCSPDESWKFIRQAALRTPVVRGIRLRRNRGQHIAASAGIRETRGEMVVLMDGDLEDPVEAIPHMIQRLRQDNCDVVYAVEDGGRKRRSSRFFWYFIGKVCNVQLVPDQLMLRVMNRQVADAVADYGESIRMTSVLMADITSNFAVYPVKRKLSARSDGSTYTRIRRLKLAIDSIIILTEAPLNIMLFLGLSICLVTFFGAVFYLAAYFFKQPLPGYTSLILAISFFGGLTTFMIGFVGRYLGNIAVEVRRRPLYHIAERAFQQSPKLDA